MSKWIWTQEAMDMLTELLSEGLSASQIAARMSEAFEAPVTKNMVIGKVRRTKGTGVYGRSLTNKPAKPLGKPRKGRKQQEDRMEPIEPVLAPAPPVAAIPETRRVTLMELTETTCRWPLGNPTEEDFEFCGEYAVPGRPYCPNCAQLAFVPIDKKRRAISWKFK